MAGSGETAEAAFGARLEGMRASVLAFLSRLTHDIHAAEDLTQETFLRAILLHREGGPPERLSGWIFRVAYRAALDGMRRRRRVPTLPLDRARDIPGEPERDPRAPGLVVLDGWTVDRDRAIEELRGAVLSLPAGTRDLFLARYGSGRSCREAAAHVGISGPNAKVRMMRGRRWIAGRVLARLREERESVVREARAGSARPPASPRCRVLSVPRPAG
jgi:RNA polymerase sigma-70 factor, ECF subfamily